MPQAVLIALMGAGMYAGYWLAKSLGKPANRSDAARDTGAETGRAEPHSGMREMGTLRPDPDTGIYRPGA